jgi:DNA-binding NarL/FixJ family response regulator/succinate dehydrogenase/fumarate reductase flavoprotein subunit
MGETIRVVLADDHAVLRAGLRALLNMQPDIEVVGEAANGDEAIRQVEALRPNVVVMDLAMPGTSGLEAIRHLTRHYPQVHTLVLTMHSEDQFILGTLKAGGSGYVLKSAADVELIHAIRQVHAGELFFDRQAMQLLLEYHANNSSNSAQEDVLSEREHEVLLLTVQGYSSREIGQRLFISAKTVDTYRQRLMQKLGLSHRADLVQYAIRQGLLLSPGAVPETEGVRDLSVLNAAGVHAAEQTMWNRTADVVVVGSGTGLMAALRAADAGLKVLVLEKADHVGGTMGISGGGLWIPNNFRMKEAGIADSREEAIEYIRHATLGQADADLSAAFVDHCNEAIEFLRDVGIGWDFLPNFNDYYPHFPGGKPRGRSLQPVTAQGDLVMGAELTQLMLEAALARGVDVLCGASARRLVVDNEGTVVGVAAEFDGEEIYCQGRRGVVLATGGFDHNEAMVRSFLRGPLYHTSAAPGNTGDGHLMGMALGAGLHNMNERWAWPVFYDEDLGKAISALAHELGRPGAIVVNKMGRRILNEAGPYDAVARAFFSFETSSYEYVNIPSFVIADAQHRQRYSLAGIAPGAPMPRWFCQAASLDELASMLGVDGPVLEETIARFNAHAIQGIDPLFHRGESDFDVLTGGDVSRSDILNPCLAPLIEPPFYGAPIWPGALGTSGGLHTNTRAQVLNVWGNIIPGLYAVGNAAASPLAGGYPGGGGTLSAGLTFAYIAANEMAGNR